jgi:hypothetical protein
VFENRVLRRIFGPKREKVAGSWRKLHNEKLYNLYASSNIIWVIKSKWIIWAGHTARMGEMRKAYNILVTKFEGKTPFGRPRRRWEDNIRMHLREMWWGIVDWMHLAKEKGQWRALVNMIMNFWVP